ncbi:MAG: Asp-tRNA(Asn)/Glu-tRNA(Gln) amidotransferase subunit GatC [Myxococcales bacterium]|jgi:aspartyl-tRNA(Asn)/glutamyl-tRNA(Gln) amidotransferase subunit C
MARLTLDDVHHVARLAALEIDEDEARDMCEQLGSILGYMEALDVPDVSGVEPTFHPVAMPAPLRADEVQPSLPRDEALSQAPASEEGGFAVPKVLDGDS